LRTVRPHRQRGGVLLILGADVPGVCDRSGIGRGVEMDLALLSIVEPDRDTVGPEEARCAVAENLQPGAQVERRRHAL
jgi:hypothetical protein